MSTDVRRAACDTSHRAPHERATSTADVNRSRPHSVGVSCSGEGSLESDPPSIDATAPLGGLPLPPPASTSSTPPPPVAGVVEPTTSSAVVANWGRVTMALAAAGVGQSGMASSAAEALPPMLGINGRRGGAQPALGSTRAVQATADQRRIAEAVTASGAIDIIVGHHAHLLQPIEQVNGVWVVWGLGNHLSNHPTSDEWPPCQTRGAS